ncbi:DNA repair protein [Vibrio vulnificus]|nr:DNA repair protein [Vibrio vulnificus]
MGWFSRACSWAASKCSAIKDKLSSAVKTVKEKCSKVWNAFTGKHYTDEAEAIYAETKKRYDDAKQIYEDAVKDISTSIESKIRAINTQKQEIYDVHFERFMRISRRLHNVTVKGQPFEELFDDSILEVKCQSGVRVKSEVIKIDFNQMGMLDTLGMVLTLGFFTRKKAKESLENAKQERTRILEDIAKLESQQKQLKVVDDSIDNVLLYFDELVANYSRMLDRFEYGIQTQRMHQMANDSDVFAHKLDFRLLPVVHLEEFRALFNLSIVLKQMANLGFLSETGELKECDTQRAKAIYELTQSKSLCA